MTKPPTASELKIRQCPQCEEYFQIPTRRGKPAIFCSWECRRMETPYRYCPWCRESFTTSNPTATYCCEDHRLNAARVQRGGVAATCELPGCTELKPLFEETKLQPSFCSDAHLMQWYDEINTEPEECRRDGCSNPRLWRREVLRKPQKYCSQECRELDVFKTTPEENSRRRILEADIRRRIRNEEAPLKWQNFRKRRPTNLKYYWINIDLTNRTKWAELRPEVQEKALEDGWTAEEFDTVPGQVSPALMRLMSGRQLPSDPDLSHISWWAKGKTDGTSDPEAEKLLF